MVAGIPSIRVGTLPICFNPRVLAMTALILPPASTFCAPPQDAPVTLSCPSAHSRAHRGKGGGRQRRDGRRGCGKTRVCSQCAEGICACCRCPSHSATCRMYVHMSTSVHIHQRMHTDVYTCIRVCVHIYYMSVCVSWVCVRACVRVCV